MNGDSPLLHFQPQSIGEGDRGVLAHAVGGEAGEGVAPWGKKKGGKGEKSVKGMRNADEKERNK